MKLFKKIVFWIVSYSIRLVLFATVSAAIAVAVIGKSSDVKEVLQQTDSYTRFVPAVIDANKAAPQSGNSLDYDDKNIELIITESFPASDLKQTTESVIDSVYDWLNGKTPSLTFKADFTKNKEMLADKLSAYAFNRLRQQPVCKSLPETINPLTVQCQPAGYDLDEAQASYRQQLLESDSFLAKTVLTEQDLPKNTSGKTLAEQLDFAPRSFRWLLRAPYVLGAVTLLFGVLYVVLSPRIRKGIAGIGSILMGSGASLALFPIIFDILLPQLTKDYQVQSGTQGTQAILNDVINHVSNHSYTLLITIGIQLFIAGLCVYLLERATRNETARYKNIEKKTGITSSNQKPGPSPRSLRGKLSHENVPLQSSDLPARLNQKRINENKKYAKLFTKKKI